MWGGRLILRSAVMRFGGQITGPSNFLRAHRRDGIEDQASIFSNLQETWKIWEVEGDRMSSSLPSALLPGATPIMTRQSAFGRKVLSVMTPGPAIRFGCPPVASFRVAGVMWTMKSAHILNVLLGR